jgi:hypothetical protein
MGQQVRTVIVRHHCPCCGYDGLVGPAYANLGPPPWLRHGDPPFATRLGLASYQVCDCCGFEFGFDDEPGGDAKPCSFVHYRTEWLATGAPWFNPRKKPEGWDLRAQLWSIAVRADVE